MQTDRNTPALARAEAFCQQFGLGVPILQAPMAGACPPALAVAAACAGAMGGMGAVLTQPAGIADWVAEFRAHSLGSFQVNVWIPDPAPTRDAAAEARQRAFLGQWGPEVAAQAGDAKPADFEAQCDMLLTLRPPVVSSIMGVFAPAYVQRLKDAGIRWLACVTTVAEARLAEAAGADAIVAQGMEAGGHRGAFDASYAQAQAVGLFALLPRVVDCVRVPVIATGGIADGRGVAAALLLGASAVQIGTAFLRSPQAAVATAWADALATTEPEDTLLTPAFSGRPGRAVATAYARAAAAAGAPPSAPYPVQRGLTAGMRAAATANNDITRMQAWAGQAAALAQAKPADQIVREVWAQAQALLA